MGAVFGSLDRDDDVLAIGSTGRWTCWRGRWPACARSGRIRRTRSSVAVRKGRFGPYVQHGKTVANLPRGVAMEEITLDEAVALLAEKGKVLKPRGAKGGRKGASGKAKPSAPQPEAPAGKDASPAKAKKASGKAVPGKKTAPRASRRSRPSRRPPRGRPLRPGRLPATGRRLRAVIRSRVARPRRPAAGLVTAAQFPRAPRNARARACSNKSSRMCLATPRASAITRRHVAATRDLHAAAQLVGTEVVGATDCSATSATIVARQEHRFRGRR